MSLISLRSPLFLSPTAEFEGEEYYKARVQAVLEESGGGGGGGRGGGADSEGEGSAGECVDADVYLWQDGARSALYGAWDYDSFRKEHLEAYTAMCEGFAADLADAGLAAAGVPSAAARAAGLEGEGGA